MHNWQQHKCAYVDENVQSDAGKFGQFLASYEDGSGTFGYYVTDVISVGGISVTATIGAADNPLPNSTAILETIPISGLWVSSRLPHHDVMLHLSMSAWPGTVLDFPWAHCVDQSVDFYFPALPTC